VRRKKTYHCSTSEFLQIRLPELPWPNSQEFGALQEDVPLQHNRICRFGYLRQERKIEAPCPPSPSTTARFQVPAEATGAGSGAPAGIEIPTLCYLPGYHVSNFLPDLPAQAVWTRAGVPACGTRVAEGMRVAERNGPKCDACGARRLSGIVFVEPSWSATAWPHASLLCPAHMDVPQIFFCASTVCALAIRTAQRHPPRSRKTSACRHLRRVCPKPCEKGPAAARRWAGRRSAT